MDIRQLQYLSALAREKALHACGCRLQCQPADPVGADPSARAGARHPHRRAWPAIFWIDPRGRARAELGASNPRWVGGAQAGNHPVEGGRPPHRPHHNGCRSFGTSDGGAAYRLLSIAAFRDRSCHLVANFDRGDPVSRQDRPCRGEGGGGIDCGRRLDRPAPDGTGTAGNRHRAVLRLSWSETPNAERRERGEGGREEREGERRARGGREEGRNGGAEGRRSRAGVESVVFILDRPSRA